MQFNIARMSQLKNYGIKSRQQRSWVFKCRKFPACNYTISLWFKDYTTQREGITPEQYCFYLTSTENAIENYRESHEEEEHDEYVMENPLSLQDSLLQLVHLFKANKLKLKAKNKAGRVAKSKKMTTK